MFRLSKLALRLTPTQTRYSAAPAADGVEQMAPPHAQWARMAYFVTY